MNDRKYVKFEGEIPRDSVHAAGEASHVGGHPADTGITSGRRRSLFPAIQQEFPILALLLAGIIFLTGCSGNKSAGDSESGWSFQAGDSQEEENYGNEEDDYGEAAGSSAKTGELAEPSGAEDEAVRQFAQDVQWDPFGSGNIVAGAGASDGTGTASGLIPDSTGTSAAGTGSSGSADTERTAAAGTDASPNSGNMAAGSVLPGVGSSDGAISANAGPADEMGAAVSDARTGYVYICGAVRNPGVYEIGEGTRVFEVIEQAGGFTKQADREWLNQAEIVTDGQKLQIYTKKETAAFKEAGLAAGSPDQDLSAGAGGTLQGADPQMAAGDGAAAQEAAGDDKVNINTADKDLLMTLPGIGESKAEAVLQYRQEHGNFGSIGDICQVSGIKEAVFSKIKDRITV